MKSLATGLIVAFSMFAGLAAAKHHTNISDANRVAVTTSAVPGTYEYNVRHNGHDGQLVFGQDEVSFVRTGTSDKSVGWNYNMLKKVKTDSNHVILVMHGGETQSFKLMGDQAIAPDLSNMVATRIAAAPRYENGK